MNRRGALVRLAIAGAGLSLLAGCGEQPGYQAGPVENHLRTSQAALFGDQEVERATCPTDLTLLEGMTFTCTLTVAGAELPFRVTLTDVRTEQVTVKARPAGVLLAADRVRDHVRTTLPRTFKGADVDCGGAYVVAKVGSKLDCRLTLGSQEKPLTVTVRDDEGHVTVA